MLTNRKKLTFVVFVIVVLLLLLGISVLWVREKMTAYDGEVGNTYTDGKNKIELLEHRGDRSSNAGISALESAEKESQLGDIRSPENQNIYSGSKKDIYEHHLMRLYLSGQDVTASWVIVDCRKRVIIKCPHGEILKGTTPIVTDNERGYLHGRCQDVSVDVVSFCGF